MDFKTSVRWLCVLLCSQFVVSTSELRNWRNFDESGSTDKFLTKHEPFKADNWQNFNVSGSFNQTLSRKRRFIYPAVTPWLFDIRVTMDIPLQGLDIPLRAYIPFTWNMNTLA